MFLGRGIFLIVELIGSKYCGKKFSLSTVLGGHIRDYHIPMARLGATGSQPSLI